MPSCHGMSAQRVEVGLHLEVAVAALPRRHRVAADGVHLDVDGEQVVAGLGAVLGDLVEEVRRGQPLALQAALHVGEREQHGVDLAAADRRAQLVELQGRLHGAQRYPQRTFAANAALTPIVTSGLASRAMAATERGPAATHAGRRRRPRELRLHAVAAPAAALLQLVRRGVQLHLAGHRHLHAVHPRRRHAGRRVHLDVPGRRARPVHRRAGLRRGLVALPDRRLGLPVDEATSASSKPYAWFSGWIYLWAGALTIAAVVATLPLTLIPVHQRHRAQRHGARQPDQPEVDRDRHARRDHAAEHLRRPRGGDHQQHGRAVRAARAVRVRDHPRAVPQQPGRRRRLRHRRARRSTPRTSWSRCSWACS